MKFHIISLFPEIFESFANTSIIKKSIDKNIIQIEYINIRSFSKNKHKKTDDYPFGGGPGMVMSVQPLADSIKYAKSMSSKAKVVYFSPHGTILNQKKVISFSKEEEIILVCGHYEGVDYRVVDKYVDYEISLGDYILTGGEIPAMVFIDAISRTIDGVLGNHESSMDESFTKPLLEYPQYTRPRVFEEMEVPNVLLSGDHEKIKKWRFEKSLDITKKRRPDLYEMYKKKYEENKDDKESK
ncbi:tRNA (guanosine(37)-N1)-methyltransferase TrmD [Alkalibaculum sp. M08DMB]|uniref:tRNA (guanine-N(1)-)-methyltransferase n=1 Tax=Alkalibaculum sporogenes TaxID=2655001 RepID=A0A6A7K9K2_9FIRM|nr:tRNA (guanosine(37)-N1)-methyltransferase TrmD [Alkalibaculum sporogenes]MPW26062.1 tRNA (guanosine(37)-N1)-methyltransferase TrmD [Alkalibaculum sporogenes]